MTETRLGKKTLGSLMLLLTAVIWGMAFAFQRVGMEHIGPLTFTAVRMACAAIAVGAVAGVSARLEEKNRPPLPTEARRARFRQELLGGICCGLFLTLANNVQQIGLLYTTAGKAGFITALYILLVPVIGVLFFHRKVGRRLWVAVFLGLVGLFLLSVNERFRLSGGDSLMCLSALLFTGHILCCDHFADRGNPLRMSVIQLATVAVITALPALLMEKPSWPSILAAAVPVLYCGVLSAGAGYTLQMTAQKYTEPAVASLLLSLESVFAVLGGALLLGERMTGRELLGCGVMFAAIILAQLPDHNSVGGKIPAD